MKRLPVLLFVLLVPMPMLGAFAQWQPTILWDRAGSVAISHYGDHVFALGDQNDDGYADFGVSGYGTAGYTELFHGGTPPSPSPYQSFYADSSLYAFYGGGTFGDINGDDYSDWYLWTEKPHGTFRYEVFFGGPVSDSIPDVTIFAPRTSAHEVYLDPVGDFNGDGFDDIYRYDWATEVGQVYFGGNPMDTLIDWTCHSNLGSQQAWIYDYGDLNGDGYSDWFSYTIEPDTTYLWIFMGAAVPDADVGYVIHGGHPGEYLSGYAIVNDLNGDGRDELVTAGGDALAIGWGAERVHETPDLFLDDPCAGGQIEAVRDIGDFNHDSYGDFVKTSESCNGGYWDGMAAIYLGHPLPSPQPITILNGEGPPLNVLGFSDAAGLGDVNGDGIDDLALGSRQANNLRGRAIVIAGDPLLGVGAEEPHALLPDKLQVSVFPNPFNSRATVSLDVPASSSPVTLTLYNLLGQSVQQTTLPPVSGHTTHSLDASTLTTGVYLLTVEAGDHRVTQKLLLLK